MQNSQSASAPEERGSVAKRALQRGHLSLLGKIVAWPLLMAIQFYRRFLSPLKPPTCRFYPTCSSYAFDAVAIHGPLKGGLMGLWRILRCQPFHPGGVDPVPGSDIERRLMEARLAAEHAESCAHQHEHPSHDEESAEERTKRNASERTNAEESSGGKKSAEQ